MDGDDQNEGGDYDIRDHLEIRGTGKEPAEVVLDGQEDSRVFDIFNRFEGEQVTVSEVRVENLLIDFAGGEPCDGPCADPRRAARRDSQPGQPRARGRRHRNGLDSSGTEIGGCDHERGNATLAVLYPRQQRRRRRGSRLQLHGRARRRELDACAQHERRRRRRESTTAAPLDDHQLVVPVNMAVDLVDDEEAEGGAIANFFGSVTVDGSLFHRNVARSAGGAIYHGVATTMRISDTTIDDNSVTQGNGGGVWTESHMVIERSLLSRNSASEGAAIFNAGPLSVVNSTLSMNHADFAGGGIYTRPATATGGSSKPPRSP